jgi:hypothetical protein
MINRTYTLAALAFAVLSATASSAEAQQVDSTPGIDAGARIAIERHVSARGKAKPGAGTAAARAKAARQASAAQSGAERIAGDGLAVRAPLVTTRAKPRRAGGTTPP